MSAPPDAPTVAHATELLVRAVEQKTGWVVSDIVRGKLFRILQGRPGNSVMHWVEKLVALPHDGPEWLAIVENLTVHETYFFRDWPQLKQLQQRMLPERIRAAEAGSRCLRLLSAGCATGEEAYSLAMLALEALEQRSQAVRMRDNILVPAPDWSLHILGTDLARPALIQAERGLYYDGPGLSPFRQFPAAYDCWFDPIPSTPQAPRQRQIKGALRHLVAFRWCNLVIGMPPGTPLFDIAACRNVLIYLAPSARQQVLATLAAAVRPGGWLLLGPTDRIDDPYAWEPVRSEDTVLYRRKV
jgi:chemotaxis protein methyltransferase CheR